MRNAKGRRKDGTMCPWSKHENSKEMVFDIPKAISNRATKTCVQAARANCRFISWLPIHAAAASQRKNNGSQTNKATRSPIFIALSCEESK